MWTLIKTEGGKKRIEKSEAQTCTETTSSITMNKTIMGLSIGKHDCKVIVYDKENNSTTSSLSGSTKLYTWNKYNINYVRTYGWEKGRWILL